MSVSGKEADQKPRLAEVQGMSLRDILKTFMELLSEKLEMQEGKPLTENDTVFALIEAADYTFRRLGITIETADLFALFRTCLLAFRLLQKSQKPFAGHSSYDEYIRSEHWQDVRRRALERGHYTCDVCGSEKNLQVHHKSYERLGHEEDEDLVVWCEDCHAKYHGKRKVKGIGVLQSE